MGKNTSTLLKFKPLQYQNKWKKFILNIILAENFINKNCLEFKELKSKVS